MISIAVAANCKLTNNLRSHAPLEPRAALYTERLFDRRAESLRAGNMPAKRLTVKNTSPYTARVSTENRFSSISLADISLKSGNMTNNIRVARASDARKSSIDSSMAWAKRLIRLAPKRFRTKSSLFRFDIRAVTKLT